jgi:hypothetical protein
MSASRKQASLAPIIGALVLLVSTSLLGFIVAFWPAEPATAAPRTRDEAPRLDRHEVVRDPFTPPPCRRPCSKWM